nr:unnamed protein product [Digitaria exilis]
MTRLTAAATSSAPNQPSSSPRRATSTPTPRSAIIRAMSPWSVMNGSITSGWPPNPRLSVTEPHPQCVRNAPTATCPSTRTCGTHPAHTTPRPRVRASNPSGNIAAAAPSPPPPAPLGGRSAHTKRSPESSSPAASSRTFSAVTGASLPSATNRTLRGGCSSSHRTALERVASVVDLSSGRRKPVGTTAGLRKTSAMSGNSRGSSSGQLRSSRRRQRCSVRQKRSMSETPEALVRNEAAIHAASWWRKVREGGEGNHVGMGLKSSTSGFLPNTPSSSSLSPAHAAARKSAKGVARPSKAALRSSTFSGGTSAVDSAPSGSPSTAGSGRATIRTRPERPSGGSLAMFLAVETKVTAWPRAASRLESSRKGMRWPNASHGNTTRWRVCSCCCCLSPAIASGYGGTADTKFG